ncbi:MAG: ATP-binding protein [Planctomycetota bacterium]
MFSRTLKPLPRKSFFLFGPRGTGKSSWVRSAFPEAVYVDLLDSRTYQELLADPGKIATYLTPAKQPQTIIIDEIQKVPALLDEVHRLIESRQRPQFVLTGSSARKLRAKGVNLLAGRSLTMRMHPLTAQELDARFDLNFALKYGFLPSVYNEADPRAHLSAYVATYLKEEVQQEGITRNLGAFSRFLQAASFSQGAVLNISHTARECAVERKVVENYFTVLEDLLLAARVPVFTRRAQRRAVQHPKFYFFDAGVYRALRPTGPLDSPAEIDGAALETVVYQQFDAVNSNHQLGYELSYWRVKSGLEVDFVLYGERGLKAFEVKRSARVGSTDLRGLMAFRDEFPVAETYMLYGGDRTYEIDGTRVIPVAEAMVRANELLDS